MRESRARYRRLTRDARFYENFSENGANDALPHHKYVSRDTLKLRAKWRLARTGVDIPDGSSLESNSRNEAIRFPRVE